MKYFQPANPDVLNYAYPKLLRYNNARSKVIMQAHSNDEYHYETGGTNEGPVDRQYFD